MKISIKHNQTEIVIDDNQNGTEIKYSTGEFIKMLEKISLEIQAIETNYAKSLEEPQAETTPIVIPENGGGGKWDVVNVPNGTHGLEHPILSHNFKRKGFLTQDTKCAFCGKDKSLHLG
jgi:hypothetical protein